MNPYIFKASNKNEPFEKQCLEEIGRSIFDGKRIFVMHKSHPTGVALIESFPDAEPISQMDYMEKDEQSFLTTSINAIFDANHRDKVRSMLFPEGKAI